MSSRGTKAINGHVTTHEYRTIEILEGAKIIQAIGNKHNMPDYSHSPNSIYIRYEEGNKFRVLREYDSNGFPIIEVAFHPEPNLTGNRKDFVLHYHTFGPNLEHENAVVIDKAVYEKYKIYLRRFGL